MDKLKLVRRTRDQIELSADARRENVSGAFVARGPIAGKCSSWMPYSLPALLWARLPGC